MRAGDTRLHHQRRIAARTDHQNGLRVSCGRATDVDGSPDSDGDLSVVRLSNGVRIGDAAAPTLMIASERTWNPTVEQGWTCDAAGTPGGEALGVLRSVRSKPSSNRTDPGASGMRNRSVAPLNSAGLCLMLIGLCLPPRPGAKQRVKRDLHFHSHPG